MRSPYFRSKQFRKWLIYILDILLVFGGGYKLLTTQSETAELLKKTAVLLKEQYQAVTPLLPKAEGERFIGVMHPRLQELLGIYRTSCRAVEKYGYKPVVFDIYALDPVSSVDVLYGSIKEPCAQKDVFYEKGEIGRAAEVESKNGDLEKYFLIFAIIIGLIKGVDVREDLIAEKATKKNRRAKH